MDSTTLALLKKLNLSGVAIAAEVRPNGSLHPIGGLFPKLLAAAREESFPRLHTVVVAANQELDHLGLVEEPPHFNLFKDPNADFHIIRASTLTEAVELLVVDAETRWGKIIDCTEELRDHRDFVGREWLKERVRAFTAGKRPSGYFLMTGEPGMGKSAFVADCVRRAEFPVYHFIKKGRGEWDNPDAFFRSLTAQLRRKRLLAPTEAEKEHASAEDKKKTAADELYATLEQVRSRLTDGEREVLWLDGLDEAYGPTGRFADVALPGPLRERLPDGIYFVLTSRPGEHLNWLADATLCETVRLEDEGAANETDVRAYFEARNQAEGLGLSAEFIDEAVRRRENNFLFAVLLVNDLRTLSPGKRTPDRIPAGLHGWMVKQFEYVVNKWMEVNR